MRLYEKITPETGKGAFWLSFLLCLAGCFFILFVVSPLTGLSKDFGKANDGYIQLAENLGDGNGYVFEKDGPAVFHRPPLYPFLLVPVMQLPVSLQRLALVVLQSLMVGCIGAFIFKIGKRLFNLSVSRIALILFLLNPWVYWNAKNPMTAILQMLLYILFVTLIGSELLIVLNRMDRPLGKCKLWAKRLAIGIVAAALALAHGAMLAVGLILLFALFIIAIIKRNIPTVKTSIIAGVLMVALIAPWTYRNWAVFERFIPVAGNSGMGYFNGIIHWSCTDEHPQRKGETHIDACLRLAGIEGTEKSHVHWKGLKDIELEDEVNRKAIEHMREHPSAFVKKVMLNSVEYYFPAFTYPFLAVKGLSAENLALTVFHLVLWILAIVGIWRAKKENLLLSAGLLLSGIFLYAVWYFPFSTFIGHSLYTIGTIPFLSILAAKGLGVMVGETTSS